MSMSRLKSTAKLAATARLAVADRDSAANLAVGASIAMNLPWRYYEPMTKHISLRLTDETHARVTAAAKRNHRSLNGQIEEYCDRGLTMDSLQGTWVYHKDGDPLNTDPANLELREQPR